jgi:hypothetical protein
MAVASQNRCFVPKWMKQKNINQPRDKGPNVWAQQLNPKKTEK